MSKISHILVARTDRIGDVVLSTPVFSNLRREFPSAFIAAMVSGGSVSVVEGNPFVDEVIVFEKKGLLGTLRFVNFLRKKRFDLVLVLHPNVRVHICCFLAGISRRVGYRRKWGFLLTRAFEHKKQQGLMHERDYVLSLLNQAGIKIFDRSTYMPLSESARAWADSFFTHSRLDVHKHLIVAIHPDASCNSKKWPVENFSQVARELIQRLNSRIIILGSASAKAAGEKIAGSLDRDFCYDLTGKTSISELAAILSRCRLFISNDSGPVHIASALKVPVISIFGRNQPGLGPLRWRPLGEKDSFFHKYVGCKECLAHDCKNSLACLSAITGEEVLEQALIMLKQGNL